MQLNFDEVSNCVVGDSAPIPPQPSLPFVWYSAQRNFPSAEGGNHANNFNVARTLGYHLLHNRCFQSYFTHIYVDFKKNATKKKKMESFNGIS